MLWMTLRSTDSLPSAYASVADRSARAATAMRIKLSLVQGWQDVLDAGDDELDGDGGEDEAHDAHDHVHERLGEALLEPVGAAQHEPGDDRREEDRDEHRDGVDEAGMARHQHHHRRDRAGAGEE